MSIGLCRGNFGLSADVTHDGVNVAMDGVVGVGAQQASLTGVTVAYSLGVELAIGDTIEIDLATGAVTGLYPGVAQVETAVIVGTISTAGDATLVFTSALYSGESDVPVLLSDTASQVATKFAAALNADTGFTAHFSATPSTSNVVITALVPAANDTTLNLAYANGTAAGLTPDASSTDTTAGVVPTKAYRISGQAYDTKDFQGVTLGAVTTLKGLLISHTSGTTAFEIDGNNQGPLSGTEVFERINNAGLPAFFTDDPLEFTGTTASAFTITVIGA